MPCTCSENTLREKLPLIIRPAARSLAARCTKYLRHGPDLPLGMPRSVLPALDNAFGMLAKVWTSDGLWKGFLRCARMMAKESGATSFIAMVQLPDKTLKEALTHPLMKVKSSLSYSVAELNTSWYMARSQRMPVCPSPRLVSLARWKVSLG